MVPVLIGREQEVKAMEALKKSAKSEFLAVYGRRRVGKTFLIRHVFEQDFLLQMTGQSNQRLQWQLGNFHRTLTRQHPVMAQRKPATNWFDAFQLIMDLIEASDREKKVIFLDELPWLDTPQSGFLSALEHFWNSWASARRDIILVVCGSSASWIINKIINHKGGLHNRITKRIKLDPFSLAETEAFFKHRNSAFERYQIVQLYMAFGGIPYYLDMVDVGQSAIQNINNLCFKTTGDLRLEFDNLYASLFKKAQGHIAVIEALATKQSGMSRDELIKAAKITNGGGATMLFKELEECGFIRIYPAFERKDRYQLYQLIDFYSLFYITFIQKSGTLDENLWINGIDHPQYRAWSGYAFEMVCLHHLREIKHALGISGVHTTTSSWYSTDPKNKAQIDLVIDRRDGIINLCEMKFSIKEFTIDKAYADDLRHKIETFRTQTNTKKSLFVTLVTAYGLKPNEHANAWVQNSITFDALSRQIPS
jgi:uncharacterized protein